MERHEPESYHVRAAWKSDAWFNRVFSDYAAAVRYVLSREDAPHCVIRSGNAYGPIVATRRAILRQYESAEQAGAVA